MFNLKPGFYVMTKNHSGDMAIGIHLEHRASSLANQRRFNHESRFRPLAKYLNPSNDCDRARLAGFLFSGVSFHL